MASRWSASFESFDAALAFLDEALNESTASRRYDALSSSRESLGSLLDLNLDLGVPNIEPPMRNMTSSDIPRHISHDIDTGDTDFVLTEKKRSRQNYDPNKARNERRLEIINLQKEVKDLEFKLSCLRLTQEKYQDLNISHQLNVGVPPLWKEICTRQLERRLKTERENSLLKQKFETRQRAIENMENLLKKRLGLHTDERSTNCDRPTKRVATPKGNRILQNALIFQELLAIEDSYREAQGVVETCDHPCTGLPTKLLPLANDKNEMKISCSKIMPFGLQATGDAWWRRWQNHRDQRLNQDNLIVEKFGLEMYDAKTNSTATFYDNQILCRYVEDQRIVIVWRSFIQPVEFKKKQVDGIYFIKKGYVVIKSFESKQAGQEYTRVSTCSIVSRKVPNPKLLRAYKVKELTDLIERVISSNISWIFVGMENFLVDQALKQ